MANYIETNEALARLFNLPRMTERAVVVIRCDGPPLIRVTRRLIEDDDIRQITERFELVKVDGGH